MKHQCEQQERTDDTCNRFAFEPRPSHLRATFLNCDLALFNCHQFYALTLAIKLLKLCLQELESKIHLVAAFCIDLTSESRTLGFSTEVSITSWSSRLCIKIVPNEGGPPQFDPAFVFVDNHI
jgi:hypothetical protein